jgi:hypothetical protein
MHGPTLHYGQFLTALDLISFTNTPCMASPSMMNAQISRYAH